ncbi:MAG TPA: hypothetical protein VK896_09125 [Gaiellaceae bacterium]|nr:hypothetical protein [Gaiellaceae bacterium]
MARMLPESPVETESNAERRLFDFATRRPTRSSPSTRSPGSSRARTAARNKEQRIYRGEVIEMMGALADIKMAVFRILRYIEGEDDDEEEETEEGDPPDA